MNQGSANGGADQKVIAEMQNKLDRVFDVNARRVNDMMRLKQYMERLKCDLQILSLNRKQGKLGGDDTPEDMMQEASYDSDRMVNDQITNTLEFITKIIEANVQNDANEDPFLDGLPSGKLERRKSLSKILSSQFLTNLIEMDTTMLSEMDYLNIMPDMDRMDIEESSFLKGSFLMNG